MYIYVEENRKDLVLNVLTIEGYSCYFEETRNGMSTIWVDTKDSMMKWYLRMVHSKEMNFECGC